MAGDRRLFIVDAKRSATELPVPGLESMEAILDLCAFQQGRGFALLTMGGTFSLARLGAKLVSKPSEPIVAAWMENDVQRWGTTTNPPAGILLGGDSLVLVMEAVDRSAGSAKVLRVVRLAR